MSGETISDILKNILRKDRKYILDNLNDVALVSEILYQKGILGKRQYQQAKSNPVQFDAAALILDNVEQAGLRGFFTFCHSLHDEHSWLENHLIDAAKKRGITGDILEPVETDLASGIYRDCDDYINILPKEVLQRSPSEKELLQISKVLSEDEWKILAMELDLCVADVDRAKNVSTNATYQAHSMLVTWKRKRAMDATYRTLALALGHCDLQHIIHKINEFVTADK